MSEETVETRSPTRSPTGSAPARRLFLLGLVGVTALGCGLFDPSDDRTGQGFGPGMGEEDVPAIPGDPDDPTRKGPGRGQKRGKRGPPRDVEPEPDEPTPDPGEEAPTRKGIRYLGDDTWRVQRTRLNGWTDDPGQLGANVVRKGRGYEIVGVRDGSDAAALGARDGDLLEEVNGYALNDQMDLIQLWAQVGSEDQFRVRLVRDGKSRVHRYLVAH